MGRRLANVFRLGVKELYSLRADPILLVLILYCFTLAVYSQATGAKTEVENVAVDARDTTRRLVNRTAIPDCADKVASGTKSVVVSTVDRANDVGKWLEPERNR